MGRRRGRGSEEQKYHDKEQKLSTTSAAMSLQSFLRGCLRGRRRAGGIVVA